VKSQTPAPAFHVPALVPVLGALVSAAALILSFVGG